MHQLILASESPRRKILLQEAGFSFHTFSVNVSENLEKNLTVDEQILQIARTKAWAAVAAYKPIKTGPFLFLSADTMVIFNNIPLGKPKNSTEAFEFLRLLSGQTHEVKTAIFLLEAQVLDKKSHIETITAPSRLEKLKEVGRVTTTQVEFRVISDQEIIDYIATGEPMDKAGAYGIQGIGGRFVTKVTGPFDNVVGLSIDTLRELLSENHWELS
jgi:septum formation protein